jgi:signal transduction histidine kinase
VEPLDTGLGAVHAADRETSRYPPGQARLAEEQAALRRVATLVALGAAPAEVFAAVAEEVGGLLEVDYTVLIRSDPEDMITVVGGWTATGVALPSPVGSRFKVGGRNVSTLTLRTGRPARLDAYVGVTGSIGNTGAHDWGFRSSVGVPISIAGRSWGLILVAYTRDQQLPADTEARLASFTELVATAIANTESRTSVARLAEEQAALRRVATLVAAGALPEEAFAAVAEEAGRLFLVDVANMCRYEPDRTATIVASAGGRLAVGSRLKLEGKNSTTLVYQTGRAARIESYVDTSGPFATEARQAGIRSAVGTPIMVEGRLWGVLGVGTSTERPLPPDTEARLASFAELMATAIANAEGRAALATLAEEQAALRRVATLAARGAAPEEVFAAVAKEVGHLLPVGSAAMCRYEPGRALTFVAQSDSSGAFPVGSRWMLGGHNLGTLVFESGRPARVDSYADNSSGPLSAGIRMAGYRSSVGTPIIVEGRLWGLIAAGSRLEQLLPPDTEARLASFTELVATAIANADSRAELMASRARIVAAADEARRRIERDLHDGAQQQLVSLMLQLRAVQTALPAGSSQLGDDLARIAEQLEGVFDRVREISRGIHPAVLSERGLQAALKALARRSAVPVELGVPIDRRLPDHVAVAAYYAVSEALANAAKHARASAVQIELAEDDAMVRLTVSDDGIGGADPAQGSGLIGLSDRIEAVGGTLEVTSPTAGGTTLLIKIPV